VLKKLRQHPPAKIKLEVDGAISKRPPPIYSAAIPPHIAVH